MVSPLRNDPVEELLPHLYERLDPLSAGKRVEELRKIIDEVIVANDLNTKVHCASGCAMCCYLKVTVADFELPAIRRSYAALSSTARQLVDRAAGAKRERGARACPFLDTQAGTCRIYADRPLDCRAMSSLDSSACMERYDDPAGKGRIEISEKRFQILGVLFAAIGRYWHERTGHRAQSVPLVRALPE